MAKKKQILFPVVFMVALTAIYTFALAFINETSLPLIEAQETQRTENSVRYVLGAGKDEAIDYVDEYYYVYEKASEVEGYAFPFTGKGLWGSISGYVAFTPDFETLLGIDFTAHSETPGLGGRIDEAWFKEQFRGIALTGDAPVVFRPSEGGNVDSVTGATLTSKAVSDIVNAFVVEVRAFAKEANLYE